MKGLTQTWNQDDTIASINIPGKPLRTPGGPGTLIYTLSGLVLIAGSALLYRFRIR